MTIVLGKVNLLLIISFCCHWHLHILFILLWIGSNTCLMILKPYMVQRERNRVQSPFAFRRLQFALPYRDAMPTHFCQFELLFPVTFLVPADLRYPEVTIRIRNLATRRTIHRVWRHKMSMPEASIYKDARPIFPQHQVRMPGQSFVVQPIAESSFPKTTPHNHLRLRVLRPNSRHVPMALLCGELVHITLVSLLSILCDGLAE